MRSGELIPYRWLEWEPASICCLEAAAVIASVAGTGISVISKMREADYQSAVARNEAVQAEQKANEDAAIGERKAITESRKTQLALSRGQAIGAASGTDATSPSTVSLQEDVAQQGGYNAMSALYDALSRSSADKAQADIDLFRGQRASAAGPLNAAGALFGGLSSLGQSKSLLKLFGD